jgi:hypothetical protein
MNYVKFACAFISYNVSFYNNVLLLLQGEVIVHFIQRNTWSSLDITFIASFCYSSKENLNDSVLISAKTGNVFRKLYRHCILWENLLNSGNMFCLISHYSCHIIDCFIYWSRNASSPDNIQSEKFIMHCLALAIVLVFIYIHTLSY